MSVTINRVYTGVGDAGTTRLAGGQEVSKSSLRIEAYGTIDELNACVGLVAEQLLRDDIEEDSFSKDFFTWLRRVQNELFDLGGELAVLLEDRHPAQKLLNEAHFKRLESELDQILEHQPKLKSFILPGGGKASAYCHQARTVCRRAERRLVELHREESQRPEALKYLNRLSDWFFVMGRQIALKQGHEEVLWVPGGSDS